MKKKLTPKTKDYSLTLTVGRDVYKGLGATMVDALRSLEKPKKIMAKGVLTVSVGGLKKDVPMVPVKIKQLFMTNASVQEVKAKWLALGLK